MKRAAPFLACLLLTPLSAKVTLAPLFCDGAVLQRGKPVPVWGTADAGEKITATFAGQQVSATAGPDGRWKVAFTPLTASAESRDLVVKGSNTLTVRDVVVGEVWIASGQSNMEWPLAYVTDPKTELAAANYPLFRQFKVERQPSAVPLATVDGAWTAATPATAGKFTAVGYFFGRSLFQKLNVPIGLINSSWGGTAVETWISPDAYRANPAIGQAFVKQEKSPQATATQIADYDAAHTAWEKAKTDAKAAKTTFTTPAPKAPAGMPSYRTPAGLNNGMIAPLVPYALRGVIWYQGESNTGHADQYAPLFSALITGWRQQFGQGDFPFYWVQLPNLDHGGLNATTWHWADLREAQTKTLALPGTGQAITIDVGEAKVLHPKNKKPVGERLALLALARTYAAKGVIDSGPLFASAKREGHAYRIFFEPSTSALESTEPSVTGFELAGADKIFLPAEARIDGATVVVTCAGVAEPVAVRYCYRNAPTPGLFNAAGLPAAPFRTDTWPAPKQAKAPPPALPES
ncbi:MAG: sialate O-acetylesterase [Rariglobus sp.]|nr:sialate O-acetylesterase [Rariglobus sp.]